MHELPAVSVQIDKDFETTAADEERASPLGYPRRLVRTSRESRRIDRGDARTRTLEQESCDRRERGRCRVLRVRAAHLLSDHQHG